MRHLCGVSIGTMMVALAASAAYGQTVNTTPSNVNVLNLLSPFLGLNATAAGQATLQRNLDQAVATNNGATLAQQQLAISDKALPGNTPFLGSITLVNGTVVNLGPGDNLAGGLPLQAIQNVAGGAQGTVNPLQPVGGLGPQLGAIYQTGIRASTATTGPLSAAFALLNTGYTFTSADLGVAKNYFANGAATNPATTPPGYVPVPAVAPAGYTLPRFGALPNTTDSVLDLAYGVTNRQPGQDVYGSSRPVQVAPNRINQFDPTALSGLATNPSFPSGHTTYAYTDSLLLAMAVPQQYQSMLLRGSEYGNSRIVLDVHYPLDIIGARALSSYDLAQAFTNPLYLNTASTTGTAINLPGLFTQGAAQLQGYLSAQCGAAVATCSAGAANTANNPYVPSAANQALYQSRLTYGLPTLTFAQAPREAAPTGGPDASILLAPLYGGSTTAAAQIAPGGGLYGSLRTSTINQIVVATETNALSAFYGTPLSYWTRLDLYTAAGYLQNVTGTLVLDPADRVTTDVTVGNGGALYANGTITGLSSVGAGGLLGGTGRLASLAVASGGMLAPGNSIGTLTVAGNATFAPGSTYQVEANAAGQSDRTLVGGTAAIGGGTVQVLAATGAYGTRTSYNILNATGGVSGQFAGVTSNLAFLNPFLAYDPNNVTLTLARNDVPFAAVAASANQASAASGIQSLGFGRPLYDAVALLDDANARRAFDAVSGEIHASGVTAQFETGFMVREAILDRLRGNFASGLGLAGRLAGASLPAEFAADLPGRRPPPTPVTVLDPRVFSLWGQGFGSFGSTGTDRNAGALNRDTSGFVIGADATLDGAYRFGVAGGFTDTSLDIRSRSSTGEVTSGFGAVYGAANLGGFALRVGGVFAGNSTDTSRSVAFAGFNDTERGRYGGTTLQGFGEAGYRFGFGAATIEPFVGGGGMVISRDRFTETGGAASLTVLGRDYEVETLTAGVRGEYVLGIDSPFTLRGLVGYRRAFGDVVPRALLAFATAGSQFSTAGVPIDRDALVAGAGIDWKVAPGVTVGVSYAGQVGNRAEDHGARGNVVWRF